MAPEFLLELRDLSKAFDGVRALDRVSLAVEAGEVHGLLGENGSGKSTLIKILAGYHTPDSGELRVHGRRVRLPLHPGQFRALGMSFVHQNLGLIESLSVVENLRLNEIAESHHRFRIPWRAEVRRAREIFARYRVSIDPRTRVADLPPAQRALVAIVRAVESMRGRGLLILDEPTVFLPKTDTDQLFALLREIASLGSSVLFVSHDLDEVREVTDHVTVLRDGRNVGTVDPKKTSPTELVELIIGRRLETLELQRRGAVSGGIGLAVDTLRGGTLRDVSIELYTGEVLGLTGLVGSGFEEVPYLLYGASRPIRGMLTLGAKVYNLRSMTPRKAIALGMTFVPADRQRDASISSLSVTDNVTMQLLQRFFHRGWLRRGKMRQTARELAVEFDVRPRDPHVRYSLLSGGNQQKALLAKWLQMQREILLLHEPTQGVDVGARQQIFTMIRNVAAAGASVICSSSDYEQLAAICDRVLIFSEGMVVQQLARNDVTKERITEQCYKSLASSGARL